jgi:hypothetical protein
VVRGSLGLGIARVAAAKYDRRINTEININLDLNEVDENTFFASTLVPNGRHSSLAFE